MFRVFYAETEILKFKFQKIFFPPLCKSSIKKDCLFFKLKTFTHKYYTRVEVNGSANTQAYYEGKGFIVLAPA
jgi:hypothetical protein